MATIQLKRGNLSGLPTLADGEPAVTLDQIRLYVGDSSTNRLVGTLFNIAATAAPTTGDDAADGYSVGSLWLDVTNDKGYVCLDSTGGAAVWQQFSGSGSGGVSDGDKGDLTVSSSGAVWTIDAGVVTLAKMADIATDRLIGRDTAGTGVPEALTVGGGLEFTGSGGIQRSALTGDVTASAGSGSTTIANDAVTYAKMQNVSATDKLLGRSTAGAGDVEEIACTAAGRALLDDADAAAQRTTLGLGTIATQNANGVNITGGSITSITDLAVADGGTGASSAVSARFNLGLAIGADVQAYDATLAALAGLTIAANSLTIGTGADAFSQTTFAANTFPARASTGSLEAKVITDFGLSLVDDADASAARTTLGLAIGSNVQGYDATLAALAAYNTNGIVCQTAADTFAGRTLTGPAAGITVSNGNGVSGNPTLALADDLAALEALSGTSTIYYRSGTSTWTAVTIGGLLSFSAGTLNVGDAELTALAGLTSAADRLPYFTGSGTAALATFTSFGRSLVDDADAAASRTTLGLGTSAVIDTGTSGTKVALTDGANQWSAAQRFINSSGITILDTDASHTLGIIVGSNLTANRTLTITTGDASRTLTLSGDATISGTISGTNTGDQTITLTGDVTGSGTGSFAATIANDAVTYAKMQTVSNSERLLGRGTSGTGNPEELSLGGGLEFSGTTLRRAALTGGDVTASAGSNLLTIANSAVTTAKINDAAVTAAKFGPLNAFTDANPAVDDVIPIYDTSASANRDAILGHMLGLARMAPGGRLTLTSVTPVTTGDVTSASTLYYTPYLHDVITLWDGTRWQTIQFSEASLTLTGLTSGRPYDVFGYLLSGAVAIEALAWTSANARATAITYTLMDGRLCKSGDKARLYLGTFYTTGTTTTEDSITKRFVWNHYNRVRREMRVSSSTSHNYTTGSWRAWNNDSALRVEFVRGLNEDQVACDLHADTRGGAAASTGFCSVGLDTTTAQAAQNLGAVGVGTGVGAAVGAKMYVAQASYTIGYHYLQAIQYGVGGTPTFNSVELTGEFLG